MTNGQLILERRRRYDAGEFQRKITHREPRDFTTDKITLECGHKITATAGLSIYKADKIDCTKCAEKWKP